MSALQARLPQAGQVARAHWRGPLGGSDGHRLPEGSGGHPESAQNEGGQSGKVQASLLQVKPLLRCTLQGRH